MLSKLPSPLTKSEEVPPVVIKAPDSIDSVITKVYPLLRMTVLAVKPPPNLTGCPGED